jgi:hypothetical protein
MGQGIAKSRFLRRLVGISLLILFHGGPCHADEVLTVSRATETVKMDFKGFYADRENLVRLGIGLAGAGIIANTSIDRDLQDRYQSDLRSGDTDHVSKVSKVFGVAYVAAPVYLGAYGVGRMLRNPTMEEWAQKSARATVLGVPAVLGLMVALGADRPTDRGESHWKPFRGEHGASGHAFIGGVPFITAAMMAENVYVKAALYGASTLAALSRINDNEHFFSQAALGWYLAYLSSSVVEKGKDSQEGRLHFAVSPVPNGWMVTAREIF